MKQYNVGIIGATGMVGQRFATLLENHPWFNVKVLAASPRSAGQTYEQAAGSRWKMAVPMPAAMKDMVLMDATGNIEKIASMVDFCFCAVDMKKDEIKALEEAYAKAECPIVSNNSAHRFTPDVPMVVPEINPEHIEIIKAQRERYKERLHRCQVKLLYTELCSCTPPTEKVRSQERSCLYLPGYLRCRKELRDMA